MNVQQQSNRCLSGVFGETNNFVIKNLAQNEEKNSSFLVRTKPECKVGSCVRITETFNNEQKRYLI